MREDKSQGSAQNDKCSPKTEPNKYTVRLLKLPIYSGQAKTSLPRMLRINVQLNGSAIFSLVRRSPK